MTLASGTVRRLPRGGNSRSTFIPLYPGHVDGDLHEGFVRVPQRLVKTAPHTNERHEFDQFIGEQVAKWVAWKEKQGWFINGTPKVRGPFIPPSPRNEIVSPDVLKYGPHRRYHILARFTREEPQWIPRDADIWLREQAITFDVDLHKQAPQSPDAKGETDIHDPMQFAEARRQELGLTRKEFLIGDLKTPLGEQVI